MLTYVVIALVSSVGGKWTDSSREAGLFLFSGLGMSAFDEDAIGDWEQCGYVPVGAQFTFRITPMFAFGAEAETTLRDFSWLSGPDEEHTIRHKVAIAEFGLFGKVFISQDRISPYLRLGGAIYAGTMSVDTGEEEASLDLETQPGINLGGGLEYSATERIYLGLEGVYHIYSAAVSNLPTVTAGWNFWEIRLIVGVSL
ncbi:MAG TPA: hypothetical protein PLX54_08055 [Candidatus Fermentibacter daniensis]|nr:hypothetical protein [Candidatus Fermentibacter daniensis]HOR07099.1 hypothetical protein [Candidatus Fermentibacter daniensis]HPK52308.1 hypothetical protein [Candidatus Fermentibacter daniensis]